MNIAIYSAGFLGALIALSFIGRIFRKKNGDEIVPSQQDSSQSSADLSSLTEMNKESAGEEEDEECCGEHEVCEKGKIKRALRTDIEYFDDEELDRFRGTASDEYEDDAVEEFREVLYTMDPREVEDWLKSLELREVALPDALKDEVFMLIRV